MLASLLLLAAGELDDKPMGASQAAPLHAMVLTAEPGLPLRDQAVREAVERGLAYLAERQSESMDGSMPTSDASSRAPVGVTALAALALMAGGNTPTRGPQSRALQRALNYILDHSNLGPATPDFGYISTSGDQVSRTHGHGFATLALAEAFGMGSRDSARVKRALEAAVKCIQASQGPEGGWEYNSVLSAEHEGSVTICYVQALRAARNAGIVVDREVIARAEDYVLRLQKDDGTFRYKLDQPDSTIGLTAAAISTLNMAGRYDSTVIQNAIDAIWSGLDEQQERDPRGRPKGQRWPFYQRLYIAQSFWQLSDQSHFERWFKDERVRMLGGQKRDGSWNNVNYGSAYATAINCLVLSIPEGVLPIFQR